MKEKIVTLRLADVKINLFVRKQLNPDHVLYLAGLIENGVIMRDPIEVTQDLVMIEGRHRKEAYELNNIVDVQARIIPVVDEIDLISKAYRANTGGSLPPTQQDTEHTVTLLLERGVVQKQIGELLGLPAGLARRYITEVKSRLARAKLMRAVAAVTEGGRTAAQAAELHGVDPEKLKEALSGAKRKKNTLGIEEVERRATFNYRSIGSKNAAIVKKIFEQYRDGDVSEIQVRKILEHLARLQKRSSRALTDHVKRFDGMTTQATPST